MLSVRKGLPDPTIERIEAELRESQFRAWDVETFLAGRHQAKIEALTAAPESRSPWRRRWFITKEVATVIMAFVGYVTVGTIGGLWLLTGVFPVHPVG